MRTLADARQYQLQTEATGEAEAIRQKGQGEADVDKAKGLAQAEVIQVQGKSEAEAAKAKGLAQAEVILKQGLSEAEATHKKAEAWQEYTQAAIIQQMLDKLPEVASAIAQPLAKTDRIVVISNGGAEGSGAGASKVTQDVTNVIAQVPAILEALTGVDLLKALDELPGLKQHAQDGDGSEPSLESDSGSDNGQPSDGEEEN